MIVCKNFNPLFVVIDTKILLVDKEPEKCRALKLMLEELGYFVLVYSSEQIVLEMNINQYSLLMFDVDANYQLESGVNPYLKRVLNKEIPIILISSICLDKRLLDELKISACDYILKPFSINEVAVRVSSLVSSYSNNHLIDRHSVPCLFVDIISKQVLVDKIDIALSYTEYNIFNLLYHIAGKVISRNDIMMRLWPNQPYESARKVDVSITRIRKKLGRMGKCIATRPGFGYYYDKMVVTNLSKNPH